MSTRQLQDWVKDAHEDCVDCLKIARESPDDSAEERAYGGRHRDLTNQLHGAFMACQFLGIPWPLKEGWNDYDV